MGKGESLCRFNSCPDHFMRLSAYKSCERQLLLWERPVAGHGGVRCAVGDLVERLTAAMVGGRRHRTDSRADYCPDVSVGDDYYESKGVGRTRTAFIYGGRLERDRAFAAEHRLTYAVWHHGADSRGLGTVEEVERAVLASLRCVFVVPFAAVDDICSRLTPRPLNSRYGGSDSRSTYGSGFAFSIALLEPWCARRFPGGLRSVEEVSHEGGGQPEICSTEESPDTADGEQVPLLPGEATVVPGVPSQAEARQGLLAYE